MNFRKSIVLLAYKPIEIAKEVFIADDKVDFNSKHTSASLYNEKGMLIFQLSNGLIERFLYRDTLLIKKITRNISGTVVKKRWYYYLEGGIPYEERSWDYTDPQWITTDMSYRYGDNYVLTTDSRTKYTYKDRIYYNELKTYNKNEIIKEEWSYIDRENSTKYIYRYNDGHLYEVVEESKKGVKSWKYFRNKTGRITTILYLNGNGEITHKMMYKYDFYGNLSKEKLVTSSNECIDEKTYFYEYDKNGVWRRRTHFIKGRIVEFVDHLNEDENVEFFKKLKSEYYEQR
jgi:hypothetical protein